MRVLVTGATGQVGRAITSHLGTLGYWVAALSRSGAPVDGAQAWVQAELGMSDFVDNVSNSLEPRQAIVHAAASTFDADPNLPATNCVGTQQIVELARRWDTSSIVYISSVPVIGVPGKLPITEQEPAAPRTAYHASKLMGEFLISRTAGERVRAVSLRITSPAGAGTPRDRLLGVFVGKAMTHLPLQIVGKGSRRQNYVDVRDVAQAVEHAIRFNASGIFNIAAAESISNHRLAEVCINELQSASSVTFVDKADPEEGVDWTVSIAKAEQELKYRPAYGIRDSIRAIAYEYAGTRP